MNDSTVYYNIKYQVYLYWIKQMKTEVIRKHISKGINQTQNFEIFNELKSLLGNLILNNSTWLFLEQLGYR